LEAVENGAKWTGRRGRQSESLSSEDKISRYEYDVTGKRIMACSCTRNADGCCNEKISSVEINQKTVNYGRRKPGIQ